MKALNLIYQGGHLVDPESKKIIQFKENARVVLVVSDVSNIISEHRLLKEYETLTSEEKFNILKEKFGNSKLVKVKEAGSEFVFRVGLARVKDKEKTQYLFKCVIKEDLYLEGLGEDILNYRLCDCVCETIECLEGDAQLTQAIPAKSLNQLYSNTIAHLFPLQRSAAANVYKEFFVVDKKIPSLIDIRQKTLQNINDLREKHVKEAKKAAVAI